MYQTHPPIAIIERARLKLPTPTLLPAACSVLRTWPLPKLHVMSLHVSAGVGKWQGWRVCVSHVQKGPAERLGVGRFPIPTRAATPRRCRRRNKALELAAGRQRGEEVEHRRHVVCPAAQVFVRPGGAPRALRVQGGGEAGALVPAGRQLLGGRARPRRRLLQRGAPHPVVGQGVLQRGATAPARRTDKWVGGSAWRGPKALCPGPHPSLDAVWVLSEARARFGGLISRPSSPGFQCKALFAGLRHHPHSRPLCAGSQRGPPHRTASRAAAPPLSSLGDGEEVELDLVGGMLRDPLVHRAGCSLRPLVLEKGSTRRSGVGGVLPLGDLGRAPEALPRATSKPCLSFHLQAQQPHNSLTPGRPRPGRWVQPANHPTPRWSRPGRCRPRSGRPRPRSHCRGSPGGAHAGR